MAAAAAGGAMAGGGAATSAAGVMAGTVGGVLQAALSYGLNAASTSKAHDRQKNMMTRGPTYIMEGLRAAGINPILAAGSAGFGGASARAPQAGSATVSGVNVSQHALLGKQMELVDAQTDATVATGAKALAETGIISAGQTAADWKNQYYGTPEGQTLLRTSLENEALPKTIPAAAARGLYKVFGPASRFKSKPPIPLGRNRSRLVGDPPYSVEDNR